jgi:hypothetical protein
MQLTGQFSWKYVQVSTIVISKLFIHIDSVPYNFQEIEIVVLDCHKLSLHVAHVALHMIPFIFLISLEPSTTDLKLFNVKQLNSITCMYEPAKPLQYK